MYILSFLNCKRRKNRKALPNVIFYSGSFAFFPKKDEQRPPQVFLNVILFIKMRQKNFLLREKYSRQG
ncbi:hypothetical protein TS65_12520 [Aneurinibacillus migulanus]|uniref:Uncharacterized protein n=1 Tax=Aneurinibacillus migulanus TaxID=47500 RepID=A0A0D1XX12_ANEMI|nr:hypothetical protein TS65_12520 [Aneurinibacillus migulanus]KON95394.1 hypothetical protein AF333_07740 [Aneurinibacillus migulanus]